MISHFDLVSRIATGLSVADRRARFALGVLVLSLVASCAAPGKRVDTRVAVVGDDSLFPNGKYQHQVHLRIPTAPDPAKRAFDFRGVVVLSPETTRVIMLSPFGTTLFRLTETVATGELKFENFVPEVKAPEARMREFYAELRRLLRAKRHPRERADVRVVARDAADHPLRYEATSPTASGDAPTRYRLNEWDERGIPARIEVEGSRFNVSVEVTGYEL